MWPALQLMGSIVGLVKRPHGLPECAVYPVLLHLHFQLPFAAPFEPMRPTGTGAGPIRWPAGAQARKGATRIPAGV